jgi:hypothetical protein
MHILSLKRVLFQAFRHNFTENGPHDLKNGLERRVSQFYTICDKNQLLNKNNGKVMAILVLRSWDASCQVVRAENPVEGSGISC